MIAYGTMKASAAWKLYAKSQNVPFEIANEVSNQLKRYDMAVKHAGEDEKDEIDVYDYVEPKFREIFERSKEYRGTVVSWSIAPCSYLLYQGSIRKEIGLTKVGDKLCCCMDGHWAEECHFLKNDLLTVQVVNLIYKAFHRIGMEPPTTNELLRWCTSDQKVWDIYAKGATMSINQVERTGTSARVRIYKPTNISELCAFIAAIRPGFKSMYKTFESRIPFSYGVKAFDELIQTPEMPNSFVLYQEQEMEALHYAGIPMSECYTAIKNIAKKRAEKVLAYEEKFKSGFEGVMIGHEGKSEDQAKELSAKLWQIVMDSSSYSFNASHSYCVALDSLYGAWLKANHPLEFYETALRIYEKKGDKDKMNDLKEEAESYFDIHFPPFRFGQDNRNITATPETNSITNSLAAIKGFGKDAGALLYECGEQDFYDFFDVLKWLDERSFKSAKVMPLVKIDYFQDYGNIAELSRLVLLFDFLKQGNAKSISKERVSNILQDIIAKHATDRGVKGNELKSYTITDMDGLLAELEAYIYDLKLPDLPYRVKAENQKEILGYVDLTTGLEADRRKLYILDVYPLKSKTNPNAAPWMYKLKCKSVGSGKISSLSLPPPFFVRQPVREGDLVFAERIHKDKRGYWNLDQYQLISS